MKKSILVAILFLSGFGALHAQTRQTREEYVDRYMHIAVAHMERYGIPASITELAKRYGKEVSRSDIPTMVANAQQLGTQVTVQGDMRITRVGKLLRKCRLDELPQLLNILMGQMSFVGTRPEVPRYVRQYTPQMLATLLLPAGVTSQASIRYKDEDRLLDSSADPDRTYVEQVLPGKMEYNLNSLLDFSLWQDFKTMVQTVGAVLH